MLQYIFEYIYIDFKYQIVMQTIMLTNKEKSRMNPSMCVYFVGRSSIVGTINKITNPKLNASKAVAPNQIPSSSKKNPKYRVSNMKPSGITNKEGITEINDLKVHALNAFKYKGSSPSLLQTNLSKTVSVKLPMQKKIT